MQWSDGKIVDPMNGKTYSATLTVKDSGNQLVVRGYIGFSLIGRSQTWVRTVAPEEVKQLPQDHQKK
jgi:uncharacterized protein (DUF2147 family)